MTLTCRLNGGDGEITCPFCNDEACNACSREPSHELCNHDVVERHSAIQALTDEPAINRTPTKPMPQLATKNIVFQISHVVDLIEFFRRGAEILDAAENGCRITVIIEQSPVSPVDSSEDTTPPQFAAPPTA